MELKTLHFSINFFDFCQLQKPLKVIVNKERKSVYPKMAKPLYLDSICHNYMAS